MFQFINFGRSSDRPFFHSNYYLDINVESCYVCFNQNGDDQMTKRPTFVQRTASVITEANANAWINDPEKWMFVTDLINECDIGYDPHGDNIDRMVRSIENRLSKLLPSTVVFEDGEIIDPQPLNHAQNA